MESTLFGVGSLTAGSQVEGDGFVLAPYGWAESAWPHLGSASETGSGLLNVSFGEQTLRMFCGVAGLRPDYAMPTEWGVVTPRLRLEYSHDFAGAAGPALVTPVSAARCPSVRRWTRSAKDTLSLSLGTSLTLTTACCSAWTMIC